MEILWVVLSLVGVLGLFFIMVYATKKLGGGIGMVSGSRIKVVDRVSLGRDGSIAVVNVAGKLMVVGITVQHIEMLAELDITPEEYSAGMAQSGAQMSFASAFAEVIRRKKDSGKDKSDD